MADGNEGAFGPASRVDGGTWSVEHARDPEIAERGSESPPRLLDPASPILLISQLSYGCTVPNKSSMAEFNLLKESLVKPSVTS